MRRWAVVIRLAGLLMAGCAPAAVPASPTIPPTTATVVATAAPTTTPTVAATVTANATATPSAQGEKQAGAQELIADLKAAGLRVERVEPTPAGYLGGQQSRIIVTEQVWVELFEYADEQAVLGDVAKISPDGFTIQGASSGVRGTISHYDWIAPPHFFRRGRIIAFYVGSDPAILEPLERVMGQQFAGSSR